MASLSTPLPLSLPLPLLSMSSSNDNKNSNSKNDGDGDGWTALPSKSTRRRRSRPTNVAAVTAPPSSTPSKASNYRPFLLLLVGLPGSGKSTVARTLVDAMPSQYVRINQDELKTRKKCEAKVRRVLAQGTHTAIIDRCNFDRSQRRVWIQLAHQFGYSVECLVLDVPPSICIQRCQQRQHHETVAPNDARRIVTLVNKQFQMPTDAERSDPSMPIRHSHVVQTSEELNAVLLSSYYSDNEQS